MQIWIIYNYVVCMLHTFLHSIYMYVYMCISSHVQRGIYRVCEIYYLRMSTVSFSVSQAIETSLIADLISCLKAHDVQSGPGNAKSC